MVFLSDSMMAQEDCLVVDSECANQNKIPVEAGKASLPQKNYDSPLF